MGLIELNRGLIRRMHLEVDFRAANFDKSLLGRGYHRLPKTSTPTVRGNGDTMQPASMPIKACHDGGDDTVRQYTDQEQVSLNIQLFPNVCGRIVIRQVVGKNVVP